MWEVPRKGPVNNCIGLRPGKRGEEVKDYTLEEPFSIFFNWVPDLRKVGS